MWIIDQSGPRKEVIADIESRSFDGLIADLEKQATLAEAIAGERQDIRFKERADELRDRVERTSNHDGAAGAFERMRAYLLAELEASTADRVGVTARCIELSAAGRYRIAVDFSEYAED